MALGNSLNDSATGASSARIEYRHWFSIDSTHRWVESNYAQLDPRKLTCVSASYQTKGRGTNNRAWLAAPDKSLLCTFYFTLPEIMKSQAAPFLQVLIKVHIDLLRHTNVRYTLN